MLLEKEHGEVERSRPLQATSFHRDFQTCLKATSPNSGAGALRSTLLGPRAIRKCYKKHDRYGTLSRVPSNTTFTSSKSAKHNVVHTAQNFQYSSFSYSIDSYSHVFSVCVGNNHGCGVADHTGALSNNAREAERQ